MIPKIPPLLRYGLAGSRSAIWATVGFSFALNLLTLAMPVFTIQLYNRVLSSGSGATLALISLAAIIAFAVAGVLEDVRAQLLVAIGCRLDAALSAPLFSRLVEAAVRSGGARNEAQALRDLDTLRTTLTGGGALALLDLPWSPLFIVACGMLHPLLGLLSLVGAGVLIGLALLNQLRSKFKATGEFYRVFPNGEVQYLHPKDGTVPERVNASRKPANTNARRIGENANPAAVKFTGKGTFDV